MRGKNLLYAGAVAGCILLLLFCFQVSGQKDVAQKSAEPAGDVRNVHDPTAIKEGGTYYVFSTRAGIAVRCSEDLVRWRLCGDVFGHLPGWAVEDVKGLRGCGPPTSLTSTTAITFTTRPPLSGATVRA